MNRRNFVCLEQSPGIYNLRAVPIKKRTMKLSWIDPTLNVRPNVVYHVKYEDRNSLKEFNVTKRTSYIVKNLRPGMRYTFYVKKNDEVDYVTVSNVTREEGKNSPWISLVTNKGNELASLLEIENISHVFVEV